MQLVICFSNVTCAGRVVLPNSATYFSRFYLINFVEKINSLQLVICFPNVACAGRVVLPNAATYFIKILPNKFCIKTHLNSLQLVICFPNVACASRVVLPHPGTSFTKIVSCLTYRLATLLEHSTKGHFDKNKGPGAHFTQCGNKR